MERIIKNLLRFIFLTFVVSIGWGIPISSGTSSGKREAGHLPILPGTLNPPDTIIQPDTTILLYPFSEDDNPYTVPADNGLYLNDPSNIINNVEYDPRSNEYELTRKIGTLNYRNPASLPFGEYQEYDMQRSLRHYWRDRAKASSGYRAKRNYPPDTHRGRSIRSYIRWKYN